MTAKPETDVPPQRRVEPWSVAAFVLPFFLSFAGVGAAIIALVHLKQHPERQGRILAWAGLALSAAHLVSFLYVLMMMRTY